MFKLSPNAQETCQLIIGFLLIEFHKGIDQDSMMDNLDNSILKDLISSFDFSKTIFPKVIVACSKAKIPLTIVDIRELERVKSADVQLESLQEFAQNTVKDELGNILTYNGKLKLADFIIPRLNHRIIVREQFINILSKL